MSLVTEVETRSGDVRFVISGGEPALRAELRPMGYMAIDEGRFATRWFPRSAKSATYRERFAAAIDEMVRQHAGLSPVPWEDALEEVLRRVEGSRLRWWLYGSGALAVRGLPVEPRDIDLSVDDAALAGRLLEDLLIAPVERLHGWVAASVGRAFHHATIEWLADPHAELDNPQVLHEQGPWIASMLETVRWRGHVIRVPPLRAQLRVCEHRDLSDRAKLIYSAMMAPQEPQGDGLEEM